MAQRARVTAGLATNRLLGWDAMAPVEPEGDLVEAHVVVDVPAAASRGRRQPMRELVEEGQALVQRIGAGDDGDGAVLPPRHA